MKKRVYKNVSFKKTMKKNKIILSSVYLIFAIFMMNISSYGYPELYLNNIGSLFLLSLMVIDIFKNILSKIGFWGLFLFSVFHSIGSTWLYSFVPYNEMFINLFGFNLDAYFEFTRNHYDRFVHLSFGLLLFGTWFSGADAPGVASPARKSSRDLHPAAAVLLPLGYSRPPRAT